MRNWRDTLIPPDTTILKAIETITNSSFQVVLVVDEERRLLGMVTDGDVRRGILRNISLNAQVTEIMATHCTVASTHDSMERILEEMRKKDLHHIPIIDEERHVCDLKSLSQLLLPMPLDNWVVIMAGGQGTRLRPITEEQPKPLLPVGDKPLLETILDQFRGFGFSRFFISLNYKADMIERYFGDGSAWGITISYLHENRRLGTAGALNLLPDRPTLPLIVMNGDVLTKINFRQLLDFHNDNKSIATMCVRPYDFRVPYGVVGMDGHRLISLEEKPTYSCFINAGIYVLAPEALGFLPKDQCIDMTALFEALLGNGRIPAVYPVHEYWLDIGRMGDYEKARGDYYEHFAS